VLFFLINPIGRRVGGPIQVQIDRVAISRMAISRVAISRMARLVDPAKGKGPLQAKFFSVSLSQSRYQSIGNPLNRQSAQSAISSIQFGLEWIYHVYSQLNLANKKLLYRYSSYLHYFTL